MIVRLSTSLLMRKLRLFSIPTDPLQFLSQGHGSANQSQLALELGHLLVVDTGIFDGIHGSLVTVDVVK